MKNVFLILMGLTMLGGLNAAGSKKAAGSYDQDVFAALIKAGDATVPAENNRCEINGPFKTSGDVFIYPDVTVADFLSGFLVSSLGENTNWTGSLNNDGNDGLWTLTSSFKGKTESYSNSYHLRFSYDAKTKTIDPASLECIQVP